MIVRSLSSPLLTIDQRTHHVTPSPLWHTWQSLALLSTTHSNWNRVPARHNSRSCVISWGVIEPISIAQYSSPASTASNFAQCSQPLCYIPFHHFLFPCLYYFRFHPFTFISPSPLLPILSLLSVPVHFTFHAHPSVTFYFCLSITFCACLLITFCSRYTSILHSYHWLLSTGGTISTICHWSPSIMSYSPFLIISPLISYQSLILSLFHLSIYPFPLVYKTHPCHSYNPVCNQLKHQSILLT